MCLKCRYICKSHQPDLQIAFVSNSIILSTNIERTGAPREKSTTIARRSRTMTDASNHSQFTTLRTVVRCCEFHDQYGEVRTTTYSLVLIEITFIQLCTLLWSSFIFHTLPLVFIHDSFSVHKMS